MVNTGADGLDSWHVRNQAPSGDDLRAVAFGNGWFVAVGDEPTAFRSLDAVDWSPCSTVFPANLNGLAYGGGQFVAVGANGCIFTSPDGDTWTVRNSNVTEDLNGVAFGDGLFVAVGGTTSSNRVVTSTNGVNWIVRNTALGLTSPQTLRSVAWGGGRFVAVSTKNVVVSTNGSTWSASTIPSAYELKAVTYGGDRFVAVGPYTTLASTNGTNWVAGTSGPMHYPEALAFGPAGFLAPGDGMWASPDGLTWTNRDPGLYGLPTLGGWFWGATYANGIYVVVGQRQWIVTSTDATVFINRSSFLRNTLHSAAFGQGRFVAVDDSGRLGISADALTWTVLTNVPHGLPLYRVRYADGRFLAVGQAGRALLSTDGVSWQTQTLPTTNALRGLTYGLGMHVVTSARGEIFTSADGTNWVARGSGTPNALNGVTCGNGRLIAVGGSSISRVVVVSTNGVDWSVTSQLAGAELRSVAFGRGQFVAVSAYQHILNSVDGTTWVTNQPGATQRWWDVAFADGVFVVGGGVGSYVMATSADGLDWVLRIPSGSSHRAVTHGNGTFLTVGDWGSVVQSDPRVWLSLPGGPAPAVMVSGPLGNYRLDYLEALGGTSTWLTLTNVTLDASPWACPITGETTPGFYRAVWLP